MRVPLRQPIVSAAREALSWLPALGVIDGARRPWGISAIVRVKDEETWLEPSIRSIATVADAIIVADNGSEDRTPEILAALRAALGERLTVLDRPGLDIRDLTNGLIERSRFRWIIRWDADFVAHTEGPRAVSHVRDWLATLGARRPVMAYLRMVELCGDLFHQRSHTVSRADCHAFSASPRLRYVYDANGYEAPAVPPWYRVRRFDVPTFFHVDVKPARRMFLSWLWKRYLLEPRRATWPGFDAYLAHELETRWAGASVEAAARRWWPTAFSDLVPYDRERFGEYPALLRGYLERPAFRVLTRDDAIVGRTEP